MNWNLYLNFLIALLSIINPIGIVPMWSELTKDKKLKIRRRVAFLLIVTSILILVVFFLSGIHLLKFFSIDLQVFKIAGGILLLLTGLSMLQGSASKLEDREEKGDSLQIVAKKRFRKIFVPMAIPRLAGPGSITMVILYGSKTSETVDYFIMVGLIVLTLFILFTIFANSHLLEKHVDPLIFNIFTRLFGIIIAAIAVQFMVEGLGEVFPKLMEGGSELKK